MILPTGNLLLGSDDAPRPVARAAGLGPVLSTLNDDAIASHVLALLEAPALLALACTSKAFYCLVQFDPELFQHLALRLPRDVLDRRLAAFPASWKDVVTGRCPDVRLSLAGQCFYSDVLHVARQCATCAVDPAWLAQDNVTRVRESISQSDFIARFETPRIPVVLSSAASSFHRAVERWKHGMTHVAEHAEDARGWAFRTGAVTLSLRAFAAYSARTADESPLYIFDARFAKTAPELAREYTVPHWFTGAGRDLFELMGDARPDYRWLIAGAPKSGSKWHVDPNCTHAWNCSVLGRKRWLMLPPGPPPAGVFASADGGSVAQPVSLIEWYLNFYNETRRTRGNDLVEFTVGVGDVVFVPSGWWHAVLNLDECVAVTQNYVAQQTNLARALAFFKHKPDQVSGVPAHRKQGFYAEFSAALAAHGTAVPAGAEEAAAPWSGLAKRLKPFTFGFDVAE